MRYNKIMMLTIIIACLFAVSAVSAAENTTDDVVSVEEDQIILEENVSDVGTFMELSSLIENTSEGATLELDNDYQNDGSTGIECINITKTITVDGKNHVLDGKNLSRIFNVKANNVVLKNIVFKNGFAGDSGNGGAVKAEGTCDVINCSFINNSAYFGGAIFNCIATNCKFSNNSANSGGAIYDCSAIDSCFENNNAKYGGAIYINDEKYYISGCSFVNCSADILGGAIALGIFSKGSVDDCMFADNTAGDGGAINVFTSADVKNCSFTGNFANVGGAIKFGSLSVGSVDDCIFENNNADNGGAIYIFTSVDVNKCIFTNNSADLGGGIYFNDSNCLVTDSLFANSKLFSENPVIMHNVTVDGEVYNTGSTGNFSELSILINKTLSGNTLNLYKDYQNNESIDIGEILISKSITIDGKGHTVDASKKSRIFHIGNDDVPAGKVTFKNIVFKNGHSKEDGGGAIYNDYSNDACSMINCSFIDCSATENGGAVHFSMVESNIFINCSFVNCRAKISGGAISLSNYFYGSYNVVANCTFVNCSASESGGAILYTDFCQEGANTNFDNCSFIHCSSKGDGGALYIEPSIKATTVSKSRFVNCSSQKNGGAIYCEKYIKTRITSSYFENNKAKSGSAVFRGTIFDCELKNNSEPAINSTKNYADIVSKELKSNQDGIVTLKFPSDAKGTIETFVNGSSIATVNVENGAAKLDLSKYIGNYIVTFAYSGDAHYNAFSKDSNVTISVNPAKIVSSNVNVLYTSGMIYKIKVYKDEGVAGKGVKVVVKLNNKQFKTLTTNSKGIASFKITKSPGTYKITISSLGRIKTNTLTVKHLVNLKSPTLKKSAKKLTLQVSLAKVNGKYLKKKTITFKINGKKVVTAKTNNKGVAKVTIKNPNVVKKLKVGKTVKYQATYLKDTVTKTTKIKK